MYNFDIFAKLPKENYFLPNSFNILFTFIKLINILIMRKFIFGLLILTMISSNPLSAQQDYRIKLQSGAIQPSSNLEQFLLSPKAKDVYNGYYYRFIQFESLPNVAQKESIKKPRLRFVKKK